MTVTSVAILQNERAGQHSLGLDRATRDALAEYARLRWPTNAAKMAAREWDLTLDEARGLVAGRASAATIDRVWKARNGGWRIIIPVLGAVVGRQLDTFLDAELAELDREHNLRAARRATLATLESRIGAPGSVADLGYRARADGNRLRPGQARLGAQDVGGSGDRPDEVEPASFDPRGLG